MIEAIIQAMKRHKNIRINLMGAIVTVATAIYNIK